MTTYQIVTQGNPIIPYTLQVTFPVSGYVANYTDPMATDLTGQDLEDLFAAHVNMGENINKTFPHFSVQDTNRNASYSYEAVGPFAEDPSRTLYNLSYTFNIDNAEITVETQTFSDLTGADLDAFLQAVAETKRSQFLSIHPWTLV